MYLTYAEYTAYGGTLSTSAFSVAELKARKRIDYLTDSRVQAMETIPEEVKVSMYTLITAYSAVGAEAQAASPLVASFSTDGYSESYGSAAEQMTLITRQAENEVRHLLYGVLDDNGVPLLYRGLDL